ncbi:MAG: carbamate kinase [Sutterella parvirubra]|uniref:Carbamate kinase n=1 Tax=Sutterella parvirubra YIT 11816 TaxID=762967 RepID=H3KFF7_9BURK|nr:carbamate kinase [Sutterella parvirubra]EHY31155.1 carbamate kinase [Sutterella parvirubra YIT 11816]MCI7709595.1 carbamate kinase [Sutterella parvirubra]MDR3770599.1 carbamate kinase [Sutterella sp.]MDY5201442.1 carbamate kinase [Sutterella parvirubra]
MRIVIALGGNALLKRGEPMTCENQRANVRIAAEQIAKAYEGNELIISHGNGPQVGLLALQNNAYKPVPMYPLDVIGGESLGMIGYMIQQELVNFVPKSATLATVLTQTQVDPKDPAFQNPTKPVGPVYDKEEAERLAKQHGWTIAQDNDKYRRVVPSPEPKRIWGLKPLKTLVEHGHIVICCGGGGIPTYFDEQGNLVGAEAVIDKDLASSLLASEVEADIFVIATDVNGAYVDWGKPTQRRIAEADPESLRAFGFAKGSMGPKVEAVCRFVEKTGKPAVIGALSEIDQILAGKAGTRVVPEKGVKYAE